MRKVMSLFIVIGIVAACSVKEERVKCPCKLKIDFSLCRYVDIKDKISIILSGDQFHTEQSVPAYNYSDDYYTYVPKGTIVVSSISGVITSAVENGEVIIPLGRDSDSLWAYSDYVEAFGEEALDTLDMSKEYASLTLAASGVDSETYPYEIEIVGNVNGLSMDGLKPHSGEFRYKPERDEDNTFSVNLPRQIDNSLTVKVFESQSGDIEDVLAIGEYMAKIGYDWSKKNLDDIYIRMDFAREHFTITIRKWETGELIEMTI